MSDRRPSIIHQARVGSDVARVNAELTDAFVAIRESVDDGRSVVVVLDDADLLGQGQIADAAVATGLLGLVRAFALEGAKPGWRVNAVAHRGDTSAIEAAVAGLECIPGLSGQLIRLGTGHVGKLAP